MQKILIQVEIENFPIKPRVTSPRKNSHITRISPYPEKYAGITYDLCLNKNSCKIKNRKTSKKDSRS